MISFADLNQKQQLVLEVLYARWKLGTTDWAFPASLRPHLTTLAQHGYLTFVGAYTSPAVTTYRVALTAAGRATLGTTIPGRHLPPGATAATGTLTPAPLHQQPKAPRTRDLFCGYCPHLLANHTYPDGCTLCGCTGSTPRPQSDPPSTVNLNDPRHDLAITCHRCGHQVSRHDIKTIRSTDPRTCRTIDKNGPCLCTITYTHQPISPGTPELPTPPHDTLIRELTDLAIRDFGPDCHEIGYLGRCTTHGWPGRGTCPVRRAQHYLDTRRL